MGKYRIATLLPEEAQTAAGTKIIDLNLNDVISRIEIKLDRLKAQNGMTSFPAADVTKIELVDGSDVLFSLTGYECQALNIYDRQCGSMNEGCHINANDEISHYGLDFGRFLYDTLLALDPKKFTNLQLKVTHTLVSGDSTCSSGTMEVRAWCFDEKRAAPSGFLMAKEIYSYTCGSANSYEYIDFPFDYPIRKMLIRAYYTGTQPADTITEFRLDENMEQKIPIDMGVETYYSFMITSNKWEPIYELFQATLSASSTYYVTPTWYWADVSWTSSTATTQNRTAACPGGKIQVTTSGAAELNGSVRGYLPNHCIEVPFGDSDDPADWYDLSGKSQVRLRLKAGGNGTNGTAQIVLQQLRKY